DDLRHSAADWLHEPGDEAHGVRWLYERSLQHVGDDSRNVLMAAGLLAAAPFPLSMAVAVLRADGTRDRARGALRVLVRHGLLRLTSVSGEAWELTHSLAYRFARTNAATAPVMQAVCLWLADQLGPLNA